MGSCTLCSYSQDLRSIELEERICSVAFLKNCPLNKISIEDRLCSICQENVNVVMNVKTNYTVKQEQDNDMRCQDSFQTNPHVCILCYESYSLCSEVQTHLVRCHTAEGEAGEKSIELEEKNADPRNNDFDLPEDDSGSVPPDDYLPEESNNVKEEKPILKDLSIVLPKLTEKKISSILKSLKREASGPVEITLSDDDNNEFASHGSDHAMAFSDSAQSSEDGAEYRSPAAKKRRKRQTNKKQQIRCSKYSMICPHCYEKVRIKTLSIHMKRAHPSVTPTISCELCSEVLFSGEQLEMHKTNSHGPITAYKCTECTTFLRHRTNMIRHLKLMHGKEGISLNDDCKRFYCCKNFHNKEEYNNHLKNSDGEVLVIKTSVNGSPKESHAERLHNAKDFLCPHCHKRYKKFSKLLACISNKNLGHGRACPHCKVVSGDLQNHIERKHPEKLYGNTCPKCFKEVADLKLHMSKIHFGLAEKQFECDQCGSKHRTEKLLNSHKKEVHSGYQEVCEICGKIFKTKHNLKLHLAVHSDERKYQCKKCGKTFKYNSGLHMHYQYYHSDVKQYKCSTCHQKFESMDDLKTHIKVIHNGIKKFQCNECSWSFNLRGGLNAHIAQVHRGEKKHVCDICGQRFGHGSSLTKHKRIHVKRGES